MELPSLVGMLYGLPTYILVEVFEDPSGGPLNNCNRDDIMTTKQKERKEICQKR